MTRISSVLLAVVGIIYNTPQKLDRGIRWRWPSLRGYIEETRRAGNGEYSEAVRWSV
jgi:hypothetical protein